VYDDDDGYSDDGDDDNDDDNDDGADDDDDGDSDDHNDDNDATLSLCIQGTSYGVNHLHTHVMVVNHRSIDDYDPSMH